MSGGTTAGSGPTSRDVVAPQADARGLPSLPGRSLAPDLARGAVLLLIALGNVWSYLEVPDLTAPGDGPVGTTALDRLVNGLSALLVEDRARPMFAILYGFGIATTAARLAARGRGPRDVRTVLARRSLGLVGLGLVHAALLFGGDILAPYGATGLLALALVHRDRAALLRWFWVAMTVMTAVAVPIVYGPVDAGGGAKASTADYAASMIERVDEVVTATAAAGLLFFFVPHVVLGILLARAGWLTDPAAHRERLGRTATGAGLGALVVNLPYTLVVADLWSPEGLLLGTARLAHELSGIAAGLAYVCLFGWLAAVRADRRRGPVVRAVTAVGERSLTCYLLQSIIFAPLLSPWGLGWGARLGTAEVAVLAVVVWLTTVGVAVVLQRAGRTGPFEALLRRWTYGRRPRAGRTTSPV